VVDGNRPERLGDFTAGPRTLALAVLAVAVRSRAAKLVTVASPSRP